MNKRTTKAKIKKLIGDWKRSEKEWIEACLHAKDINTRNRFEGIAKGIGWCVADLVVLLDE